MPEVSPTSASQIRLQYAQEIANTCPSNLYDEIALTGSSARGIATDKSDIEINFWVRELPSLEERKAWIESLNTTDVIAHEEPRPDNSYWVNAMYKGIELEAGWQTYADIDSVLTDIMSAKITDHKTLRIAELVLSANSLRGEGVLERWQPQLENYPVGLTNILITDALTNWLTDDWIQQRLQSQSIKEDVHRIWRIIYALNHRWEINWKYTHHDIDMLETYPKNIINRIWDIQALSISEGLLPLLSLIEETLLLLPSETNDESLQQSKAQVASRMRQLKNT